MDRQAMMEFVRNWDPNGDDLPDEIALALDSDTGLRELVEKRYPPVELELMVPSGLAARVMPQNKGASAPCCPFCDVSVADEVLIHGGRCTSCFADIPGEESATDPGAVVRERQHAQDVRRVRGRMFVPMLLAAAVMMGVFASAGALLLWPEPQMALLDLDDETYAELDFSFDAVEEVVAVEEAVVAKKPRRSAGKKKSAIANLRGIKVGSLVDVPVGDALVASGPKSGGMRAGSRRSQADDIEDVAVPENLGGGPVGGLNLGIGIGGATISRNQAMGVTLTDDNAIIEMVQRVLKAELRKIKTCYTQQLKADENLAGRWVLTFTVAANGRTKEVDAAGKQVAHEALERCLVQKVQGWRFQPIKADLPVKKTVTFKPSF